MGYVLLQPCPAPARQGAAAQRPDGFVLNTGHWCPEAPADLTYTLAPAAPNAPLPAYLLGDIVLFSRGFIAALTQAGVHNLQVFAAQQAGEDEPDALAHYQAVNVLGCVDARCFSASHPHPITVVDQELYLDPDLCEGFEMFRVAHVPGAIVLHTDVVAALKASGFDEVMCFAIPA